MLSRIRKFRRLQSIAILTIGGLVLVVEGDVTARIIGIVLLIWSVALVVLRRKRIFFMFSGANRN